VSRRLVPVLLETLRFGAVPADPAGRWEGVPLDGLDRLLAYEGAELWLFRRWRSTGAIDRLPEAATTTLRQRAIEISGVSLRIEEAAVQVLSLLRGAGIPVTLIKGMARKALAATCPYLDARGTQDVDLLVEESRVHEAQHLLMAAGYEEAKPGEALHHHLPALWNEARVGVELHWTTSRTEPGGTIWRRFHEAGTVIEWHGHQVRVPPATELAWHAAHHAVAPAESVVTGFRLTHFLEVAALEAASAPIDWDELMRRARETTLLPPDADVPVPAHLVERWLGMARWLGGGNPLPERGRELEALLTWRLLVLTHRPRMGRALFARCMEEGPRALIGAPAEPLLPGVSWLGRTRRVIATGGTRLIFRTWRAWHRA